MKQIALVLLIANLALGGFIYWTQNQSSMLANQNAPLNASKISLQSARMLNDTPANAPRSTATSSASEPICVEWRGMAEADLKRSREAVKKFATQRVLSVEELPLDRMYWVIFPPLPSEATAKVKLNELTALKIKEVLIIKDGPWKNGISLGLYAAEDSARRYMLELEAKGVSGLRVETRAKQGSGYYYLVKTEDATILRELDEIRLGFPATTLIRVACKK